MGETARDRRHAGDPVETPLSAGSAPETEREGEAGGLPVLPLKNTVLFPQMMMPLAVGRAASLAAVEAALASEDKMLLVVPQVDSSIETPTADDLFTYATTAVVKKAERAENTVHLLVQGLERVERGDLVQSEPYLVIVPRRSPVIREDSTNAEAMHREVIELATQIAQHLEGQGPATIVQILSQIEDRVHQVYLLAMVLGLDAEKGRKLLAASDELTLLKQMHEYLRHELQVHQLREKIASSARSEMSREQREYYLKQQLRAIQEELGQQSPEDADVAELRRRLDEVELPEHVKEVAERELSRLERMPASAADYQLTRSYLELILELPWSTRTPDNLDLEHARRILDDDHYDLKEIKDRIVEHLAVMKLNPRATSPILCFVGPPGVGKTSLGKSIARALGRKFARIALGGLHDEAELRGHRRTYIGAMPGRVIRAIRDAHSNNPLIMLDEVDKLGRDFRGDPAAALMEILDPQQNCEFHDNYLDLAFDLSHVFFICTANTLDNIPRPLLDRMELLRLSGYSDEEKMEIARRYLIPRQVAGAGLTADQLQIGDESLRYLIRRYTREAGVRELERTIGRLARKAAVEFVQGRTEPMVVQVDDLAQLLGPERFHGERLRCDLSPGVAAGLAWTEAGGDVLYIESTALGEGKELILTGQLGDVMQESARTARSYLIAHAAEFGLDRQRVAKTSVHIHIPAGAVPKDGPSAGVTLVTALASLFSHHVVRSDTAMTGEITLSGLVLPVGGIKEKVLAAHRAGLHRVILPRENEKDLEDLPDHVKREMTFVLVERIEEVLRAAIPQLQEIVMMGD